MIKTFLEWMNETHKDDLKNYLPVVKSGTMRLQGGREVERRSKVDKDKEWDDRQKQRVKHDNAESKSQEKGRLADKQRLAQIKALQSKQN